MSCEHAFLDKLRTKGFRLTPQREMVLSVMHEIEGFASAEEVFDRVRRVSSSVDISTVYRTLDLLLEFEMVAAVDGADGRRRYELLGVHGRHLHLVCRSCGQVTGAEIEIAERLAESIKEECGFTLDLDNLSFSGICADCKDGR